MATAGTKKHVKRNTEKQSVRPYPKKDSDKGRHLQAPRAA